MLRILYYKDPQLAALICPSSFTYRVYHSYSIKLCLNTRNKPLQVLRCIGSGDSQTKEMLVTSNNGSSASMHHAAVMRSGGGDETCTTRRWCAVVVEMKPNAAPNGGVVKYRCTVLMQQSEVIQRLDTTIGCDATSLYNNRLWCNVSIQQSVVMQRLDTTIGCDATCLYNNRL